MPCLCYETINLFAGLPDYSICYTSFSRLFNLICLINRTIGLLLRSCKSILMRFSSLISLIDRISQPQATIFLIDSSYVRNKMEIHKLSRGYLKIIHSSEVSYLKFLLLFVQPSFPGKLGQ
jgi:hypothetical protein